MVAYNISILAEGLHFSALVNFYFFLLNDGIRDGVTGIVRCEHARASPHPVFLIPIHPTPRIYPLASFTLPFATSCPAKRGKADVQSGSPADAGSLRETGSVDRHTPRRWARVPSNSIASCGAVSVLFH